MKGKRFGEEQIIAVLKESEAGAKTKELCRRHGSLGDLTPEEFANNHRTELLLTADSKTGRD